MTVYTAGFYAVEANLHQGYIDPLGEADMTYLAVPSLALSQSEVGIASDFLLTMSDSGYRTLSTDPSGVVAYPPTIISAFQVDVAANLDPTASAVGAAWGTLSLSNIGHILDVWTSTYQTDGQAITIYRGEKTLEQYDGYHTGRATAATFLDSIGVLESVGVGVARPADYSGALTLLAKGSTNYIRNSAAGGGTTGALPSPGVLPTNWSIPAQVGLTITVVGFGTVSGLPYMDIQWAGTMTAGFCALFFEANTIVHSPAGASWTLSASVALVGGALTNVSSVILDIIGADAAGGALSDNVGSITTPTSTLTRSSISKTVSTAGTVNIGSRIQPQVTLNQPVNFTLRVAGPMLEGGNSADPYVSTTTTPVTRAATYTAGIPAPLNEPAAINYVLSTSIPAVANMTIATSTDVPAMLSGLPVWKHFRTATAADTNTGSFPVVGLPTSGVILRASIWIWWPWFMPGKSSVAISIEGNTTSGSGVAMDQTQFDCWQRITCRATLTAGFSTTNIVLRVNAQLLGDVLYTSAWQLEIDPGTGSPTSFITPAVAPAPRAADLLHAARNIWLDPAYASLVPVFRGVMGPWQPKLNQVDILLRDASYYLEKPVPRLLYGGTGGKEGTVDLTGVAKPTVASGTEHTRNIQPLLIDPANLVYQYNDGVFPAGVSDVYDGGVTLTADTPGDVYGTAPAAGHYRSDGKGMFVLGSPATFLITADANQALPSFIDVQAYDQLTGLLGVPATMIAPSTNFGNVSVEILSVDPLAHTYAGALEAAMFLSQSDSLTGIDFMSRLLGGSGMLLVPCRDGKLRLAVLAAIPVGAGSALTFDDSTMVSITPIALPASINPPPWRMRLAYGRNWTVQTSQLGGAVTAAQQAFISAQVRVVTAISPPQIGISRPTDPPVIGTDSGSADITGSTSQHVVNFMAALWGVQRRLYEIVVPASIGLLLDWTTPVTVIADFDELQSPGKKGQIVGRRFASGDSTATFKVLV